MGKSMVCLMLRVREMQSPYKETFRGFRLEAATENKAGCFFGKERPSFQKPHLVRTDGDYAKLPTDYQINRFIRELEERGYHKFIWVD